MGRKRVGRRFRIKTRTRVAIAVILYCALVPLDARAAGPAGDQLAAVCHAGSGFSSLGNQVFRREAELLSLMGQESALMGPLEKTKSKFELYDQTLTAAEFSLASLSLNAVVLGSMGTASAAAANSTQAVTEANRLATLRQAINATIGTAGIVWAASYHSDYGDFLPDSVGAQDLEKAQIKEQVTWGFAKDDAYATAQKHLSSMIGYYTQLDNTIRLREIEQHQTFQDQNWISNVAETDDCSLQHKLGADVSTCDSERMWRLVRYVLPGSNYFHQKTQSTLIDLSAVQSHLKLYMDELRFLSSLYGQLLAHCELKNDKLATGETPSPASVWNGIVAASKNIKQLPDGEAAPALRIVTAAR